MKPLQPSAETQIAPIGAKLRATRRSQGLTLEQLALTIGVTKGFLSRVERDETSPSVSTLVQLCQSLSLPIGALFEAPDINLIALENAPRINMGGRGVEEWLITAREEPRVQVIRSRMSAQANGGDTLYTINCDVEVLHVISGAVAVHFVDRVERLRAGDTLTFPGRTPHNWRTGDEAAEVVWTLIPAAWSGAA